jgi:anti-sigma factor RsiW
VTSDGQITPELLADMQAGLLDDATAAQVRRRARTDEQVARDLAALDRVRRDLAELGSDSASAPEVPAAVTTRIGAALRSVRPPPAHADHRSAPKLRTLVAGFGVAAAVIGIGVGAVALLLPAPPALPAGPTAEKVVRPNGFPLTESQLVDLLARQPDLGPLSDPARRAACLAGLGYPTTTPVLAGAAVDVGGQPGQLLVLPDDPAGTLVALVVRPGCSSIDTGLLAETTVNRPAHQP